MPVAAAVATVAAGPGVVGDLTPELLVAGLGLAILLPVVPFALEMLALRRLTTGAFGTLMALESSMSRCEQLGQQLLVYGRPVPVEEIVEKIGAVDRESIVRVARRLRESRPTVAALGPIGRLEEYDRIAARFR